MVSRRQLLKLSALSTASFAAPLAYSTSNITMSYNTGNPLGSTSQKDLSDNSRNLDYLSLGPAPSYPDRTGVPRKSWSGMEAEFNAEQARREAEFGDDQAMRSEHFDRLIGSSGYSLVGDYIDSPLLIERYNQYIMKNGQPYRLSSLASVPYTTIGDWEAERDAFFLLGDDVLRQELADPSKGASMIWSKQTKIANAVSRSVNDRLNDRINFLDKLSPDQRADVESGAGTLDCTDAWNTMLDSLRNPGPFIYPVTPKIEFPMGVIYFASEKIWGQRIHIIGQGGGQNGGDWGTKIKFPANCAGFTPLKGNSEPTQYGADASILEGLYIEGGGQNSGARTKHGIDMQSRITVRNCTVVDFSGNNINIVADATRRRNANLWILDNVKLSSGGVHGLYVQGGDTNAGIATMVNASGNNRSGICDASFLGNTYIACHTASNGKQGQVHYEGNRYYCTSDTLGGATIPGTNSSVWVLIGPGSVGTAYPTWVRGGEHYEGYCYQSTNSNARNVFVGCYSEGSQPPARILAPAVVLGGIISGGGAGMTEDSTGLIIAGGGRISDFTNSSHGSGYSFAFGKKSVKAAFGLFAVVDHVRGITQQWDATLGIWVWKWANSTQMSYMTTKGTTIAAGRPSPVGGGVQGFPAPFIIGESGTARTFGRAYWTTTTGNPTSGEFAKGDLYLFSGVTSGGKIGVTCTTAGVAGSTAVFKKFGVIDA